MSGIFLRELERTDLPVLNTWRADYELVRLLGGTFRYVGSEIDDRWFDSYISSRSGSVRLAICREGNGEMIGAAHLLQIDWVNRSAVFSIQIGDPSARGRGFGEAATRLTLRHAFSDLNLRRVSLEVLATNERAVSLYKKVGFLEEGVFQKAVFKDGRYVDVIPMAILAKDGI